MERDERRAQQRASRIAPEGEAGPPGEDHRQKDGEGDLEAQRQQLGWAQVAQADLRRDEGPAPDDDGDNKEDAREDHARRPPIIFFSSMTSPAARRRDSIGSTSATYAAL